MKNLKKIFQYFFLILYITIFISPLDTFSQGTYFHDADFVYLREGNPDNFDSVLATDQRSIYWDMSSIDTNANRLDICIGYNELHSGPQTDYLWGNWLRNENNVNFNYENPDLRYLYSIPSVITDSITGISFINLKENAKNYLVVLRASGNMEIRKNENSFIQINNPTTISNVFGKNPVVGKFSTDTLQDLAIITPTGIRVFKGTGGTNPTLEEVFVIQGYVFKKIAMAQINKRYSPYSIIDGETSNRDEIIAQYGNNIYIFNNNNNNTTNSTPTTTIGFSDNLSDFKVADMNNDGYNDIISITQYEIPDDYTTYSRISIFLNNNGTINTSPIYVNDGIRYSNSLEAADFNKDGWNDLIIDKGTDTIALFINNKTSVLFSNNPSESFRFESAPGPFLLPVLFANKITATDLYNKGGMGIIMSGWVAVTSLEKFETIIRINATTTDAVPAPPLLFKNLVLIGQHYRPRLHIYNRGDRDFQKYIIYKKSPNFNNNNWFLYDSSNTSGDYVDDAEAFNEGGLSDPPPPDNLFYYVKAQDNSYQASISSDTIGYPATVCPGCGWEAEDNFTVNNISSKELPIDYSVTNYPNPFNPVTQIYFNIPVQGNVRVTVFNIAGQKVSELINEYKSAGNYKIDFNGSNFASGIYYYRIEAGSFSQVRKMILLK